MSGPANCASKWMGWLVGTERRACLASGWIYKSVWNNPVSRPVAAAAARLVSVRRECDIGMPSHYLYQDYRRCLPPPKPARGPRWWAL